MGTDLTIISNHSIDFNDFDFDRLGREIAARLNRTRLENPELYWLTQAYWRDAELPESREAAIERLVLWQHEANDFRRKDFYGADWPHGRLEFSGPFDWEIEVWPGKADFSIWHFRYWGWVQHNSAYASLGAREAYRQVLSLLVRSLGGNEATYLADNAHPLEGFCEPEEYATIRQNLQEAFGPPLTCFAQMEAWQDTKLNKQDDRAYLVDDFGDLR